MDRQRLADALAYEQARRSRLASFVPMPADNQPGVAPTPSLRSNVENLSIGLGEGLTNQLEGVRALVTDPIGTAKNAYEAVRGVVRDPRVIAQVLREMGSRAASGPLGAGEVIGEMIGPMRGRPAPDMLELDVYHGTPHRFPATEANPLGEFDANKIGTGEGQQVYGHGIYLAEAQDVGDSYRRALTPHQVTPDAAQTLANYAIRQRREPEAAIQWLEKERKAYKETPPLETMKQYDDAIAILRQGNVGKVGNLYKADLPDEMIDRMLDWDKRISDQPEFVKGAWQSWQQTKEAQKLKKQLMNQGRSQAEVEKMFANPTGQTMHGWIYEGYGSAKGGEKPKVAKFLQSQGVLGVKYQDAGSRGQGGSGTRNFVVFPGEEKKVKILERK